MNEERRRARRPDAGRGREAHPRLDQGARPAREARGVPSLGRASASAAGDRIEPLDLAPVVVRDGGAGKSRRSRRSRTAASARIRSQQTGSRCTRSSRTSARLVHLAPDLVGPPDSRLVMRRTGTDGGGERAGGVRRVRVERAHAGARTCSTPGSRPRCGRSRPRLARADAGARDVLPGRRVLDRPGHQLPLGIADDLGGPRADGRGPVPRRQHTTR